MGAGQPKKYNPEQFNKLVEEYFQIGLIVEHGAETYIKPKTISGLCDYLDIGRVQLEAYRKDPNYHNSIERAYRKILAYTEEQLFRGQGQVNGVIFNLRQNWNWNPENNITVKTESKPDLSALTTKEIKEILRPGAEDQGQELESLGNV